MTRRPLPRARPERSAPNAAPFRGVDASIRPAIPPLAGDFASTALEEGARHMSTDYETRLAERIDRRRAAPRRLAGASTPPSTTSATSDAPSASGVTSAPRRRVLVVERSRRGLVVREASPAESAYARRQTGATP